MCPTLYETSLNKFKSKNPIKTKPLWGYSAGRIYIFQELVVSLKRRKINRHTYERFRWEMFCYRHSRDVASSTKKQYKKWAVNTAYQLGTIVTAVPTTCTVRPSLALNRASWVLQSLKVSTSCSFWPAENYCFKRRKTLKEQFFK